MRKETNEDEEKNSMNIDFEKIKKELIEKYFGENAVYLARRRQYARDHRTVSRFKENFIDLKEKIEVIKKNNELLFRENRYNLDLLYLNSENFIKAENPPSSENINNKENTNNKKSNLLFLLLLLNISII